MEKALSAVLAAYGGAALSSDPVEFPHRFRSGPDIEAAAFISAAFAFGNVPQIKAFLARLFDALGPSPHAALTGRGSFPPEGISPLRHRFISPAGVRRFLRCVRAAYLAHGTLEALYRRGIDDAGTGAREWLSRFLAWFRGEWGGAFPRERDFLFPDPWKGSACKRHNLFLRWMVRGGDGVDLGIWTALSPRDLIVPLDTHMARLGRWMGLTKRCAADWKAAEEITAAFRSVCPEDPVRFDFALTRIGILKECTLLRAGECNRCAIAGACIRRRLPGRF
ncbi:MAG: TIGR02757 family protein [Deltaproteobacteria bacterium]|nr:TIGR02757 family protein [Deltaproteobacteria bacterium]